LFLFTQTERGFGAFDFDGPPIVDADDPDEPAEALIVEPDGDPEAGEALAGDALPGGALADAGDALAAGEALDALIDGEPDAGAFGGGGFPPFFAFTNLFSLGKAICRSSFALPS
jgi:hypothetical protein